MTLRYLGKIKDMMLIKCIDDSDLSEPDGGYGKSKREAELELLKIDKASGMHVAIIRPSLVCGLNVKGNLKLMFAGIKKGWFSPLPLVLVEKSGRIIV